MGMSDAQFKAFLREQLKSQKEVQEELSEGNIDKAKELIDEIVQRTQENIEDL